MTAYVECGTDIKQGEGQLNSTYEQFGSYVKKLRLDLKSLEHFSYLMAKCLSSGLSAKRSLELSGYKSKSRHLRTCIDSAIVLIDQGYSISEALKTKRFIFPHFYIPVIRCGEESGRIVEAFKHLQDYCQKLISPLSTVRKTWLYPIILILFGWTIRTIVYLYFGAFREAWILVQNTFIRYTLIGLFIYFLLKVQLVKIAVEWIRLRIPIIRETEIDLSISLFFKTFNLMYKTGGMNVVTMLDLASSTIGNSMIRKDLLQVRKELALNRSFEGAFTKPALLKQTYKDIISVGSVSGKLDDCLDQIVKVSTQELEYRLDRFNKIFLRIIVFNVVFSIVITIMLFRNT